MQNDIMKPVFNKNKIYLLLAYLSLSILCLSFIPGIPGNYTLVLLLAVLLSIIVLSYEPLLRTIEQARGYISGNDELSFFSAFIELNKKIHKFQQVDDVLILVRKTLTDKIRVKNMVFLLNPCFSLKNDPVLHQDFPDQQDELTLRVWPEKENHYRFLTREFGSEVLQLEQFCTKHNASALLRQALAETGSSLIIPIVQNDRILCVIMVGYINDNKVYSEFEIQMYEYLANQLSIVLDRIRVYEQVMHQTAMDHAEKMQVMQSLSANIAHEMRTPLSGIRASISGIETYLPDLISAYEYARHENPEKYPAIRENHLGTLKQTPDRITLMIDQASAVIDMLLMNLRDNSLDQRQLSPCSAAHCLLQAVDRYPFKSGERDKVHLYTDHDFRFLGNESLLIYVLFNLLKNALYAIKSAEKGEIDITLQPGQAYNRILFRDTGEGIERDVLARIFEGFFTTKADGTGAGLAFCKRTIESFGGEIQCISELGSYTEFIIQLPAVELNAAPR